MSQPDAASSPAPLEWYAAGVNPRAGESRLRERLYLEPPDLPAMLADLKALGLGQCLLLSTCDRVELIGASADPLADATAALTLLAQRAGLDPATVRPHRRAHDIDGAWVEADHSDQGRPFLLTGQGAVRHVFAVPAGLLSSVIGEPQVFGQVKEAHRFAVEAGLAGKALDTLMQAAYGCAKQVRHDTPINEGPVGLAAAACQVALDLHGDLRRCSALLLGSGEMGELLAERLMQSGLGALRVLHPRARRAAALAARLGCSHAGLIEETEAETAAAVKAAGKSAPPRQASPDASSLDALSLGKALTEADIVLAALGDGRRRISRQVMRAVLKARRHQPMLIVEAAVPPDCEPSLGDLDGAFLYDLDDLERLAASGRSQREQAAQAGWALVEKAVARFEANQAARSQAPVIASLRASFEAERQRLLASLRPGTDAAEATRLLINRLLHAPSLALAERAASGHPPSESEAALLQMLPALFHLPDQASDPGSEGGSDRGEAAGREADKAAFPGAEASDAAAATTRPGRTGSDSGQEQQED